MRQGYQEIVELLVETGAILAGSDKRNPTEAKDDVEPETPMSDLSL